MWSNGFLHTLELRPRQLRSILVGASPRWLAHASGLWLVDGGRGEIVEARLVRGWMLDDGRAAAVTLAGSGRKKHHGWLLARDHDPDTWRRLSARLRCPR